jgi:hypothetical protein
MEASAIIAVLSVTFAGVTALIHACFQSMSLSRCSNIRCCYGMLDCVRQVLNQEEMESVLNQQDNSQV